MRDNYESREPRYEAPLPDKLIDGGADNYRKLGTSLKPGAWKELYSGHIVLNTGRGTANLRIFTPKTPEYEAMLEEFKQQNG